MPIFRTVLGNRGGRFSKFSGFARHLSAPERGMLWGLCTPALVAPPPGLPYGKATYPSLAIQDVAIVSDTISVTQAGIVGLVEVFLHIEHTWPGDMIITLEKGGVTATIVEEPDYNDGFVKGIFGVTDFEGEDAAGDWTLHIDDQYGGDVGTLFSWSILLHSAPLLQTAQLYYQFPIYETDTTNHGTLGASAPYNLTGSPVIEPAHDYYDTPGSPTGGMILASTASTGGIPCSEIFGNGTDFTVIFQARAWYDYDDVFAITDSTHVGVTVGGQPAFRIRQDYDSERPYQRELALYFGVATESGGFQEFMIDENVNQAHWFVYSVHRVGTQLIVTTPDQETPFIFELDASPIIGTSGNTAATVTFGAPELPFVTLAMFSSAITPAQVARASYDDNAFPAPTSTPS